MLGLPNRTDGSLFIYNPKKGVASKPDGYYYYEGITFILDAKKEGGDFTGQLEDYMKLESNENFVGFKYNGNLFECYVKGRLIVDESEPKDKDHYKQLYFKEKTNNEAIVEKSAKKLANLFRGAGIDKQMNVPFIGAAILCMKYGEEIDTTSTKTTMNTLRRGIENIIADAPINRKQKKEFIKTALADPTLMAARKDDVFSIISEISTVYNFINLSSLDYKGHDIMNSFLRIFRKWNSANANEKGEVFTPDHIAQLMYILTDCSSKNTIMDITCGSGTFLTNSMAQMLKEAPSEEHANIKENQIIGIEKNTFNATLAGMNMMLHGDGASNIFCDDCFRKLPELQNCYDRVLMNPPFSLPRYPEWKFVLAALENMQPGGKLAAILPKSCVKGTDRGNISYLNRIFGFNTLKCVISLPNGLFEPNAGVATCIVFFEKTEKKHMGETILIDCSDDGYELRKENRVDTERWKTIKEEVIKAFRKKSSSELRVIGKALKHTDELLFEAYSSNRPLITGTSVFGRYLRENIAAKVLCGMQIGRNSHVPKKVEQTKTKRFKISDLIRSEGKGKDKSIDRKLEDKYSGRTPLIIAKKDNNGIGGKINNPVKVYKDKICIITGGDGGGGKAYYCDFEFAATNFVMVCSLLEKHNTASRQARFYLSVAVSERLHKTIGHGRTIKGVPTDIEITLPVKQDGSPDFDTMANQITALPMGPLF